MKVAILGKLDTKYYAPFFDDTWTIWSMNKHIDGELIPRVDLWFDLHTKPQNKQATKIKKNFPFNEIHSMVGGKYFVTTAAYLIAYACYLDVKEIALYGMRFTDDGNSRRQRELHNVREMIFFARGKGIKVTVYEEDKPYLLPEHIVSDSEDFDQ